MRYTFTRETSLMLRTGLNRRAWLWLCVSSGLGASAGCARRASDPERTLPARPKGAVTTRSPEFKPMTNRTYPKPSATELRARLSSLEFEVTQHEATEPPFRNRYWDHH